MNDINSPNYWDYNLGDPRKTPEEKEIAQLRKDRAIKSQTIKDLRADLEQTRHDLGRFCNPGETGEQAWLRWGREYQAIREELEQTRREVERLGECIAARDRVTQASNEHWQKATAKVRHLWEHEDMPGIEGICARLAAAEQRASEAEKERDHMRDRAVTHIEWFLTKIAEGKKEAFPNLELSFPQAERFVAEYRIAAQTEGRG